MSESSPGEWMERGASVPSMICENEWGYNGCDRSR